MRDLDQDLLLIAAVLGSVSLVLVLVVQVERWAVAPPRHQRQAQRSHRADGRGGRRPRPDVPHAGD